MDAVKLPLTAAITVSKLMGSEGFGNGARVTVEEVETRGPDRVSILVNPSIDTCSSFRNQKVNPSKLDFWNKVSNSELRRHASQISNYNSEDVPKDLNFGSPNCSLLMRASDAKQVQRKSGKVARSGSGCSKRSRMAQMEVSENEPGVNGTKEKVQMAKQKNNSNGKRGDKRNGKVPKSKYDPFSLKQGLMSFSLAAGVNGHLGVCGPKPDIFDVTKHVDELSLKDLLDGSYKCPSLTKDKGKKAANLNENILHSVRKACSVIRLQKPVETQNCAEIDNSYSRTVSPCLMSSGSPLESKRNVDEGATCNAGPSSCNKVQDSCSKLESPADVLDFPLCEPKDILERLALPPPKDLESLLLDAAKPALSSRNNPDVRSKPVSHRAGVPPFPWSHNSSGHCKSNADAVKLSTNRTTCQGRWVKVGNILRSLGGTSAFLADLESLTYDQSLVPSGSLENKNVPSTSTSFTAFERSLPSSTIWSDSQAPSDDHSPRQLAAAQTLHEIASSWLKQNPQGMTRWPKEPSQKAMKACKLKLNEQSEKIFAAPKSSMRPDNLVKGDDEMLPPKKLKLSVNEKSVDVGYTNTIRKGTINWSTPRSSRSSPSRSLKDSIAETKHYNANIFKKSCMMPPPSTRVSDKACYNERKLSKSVPMEWSNAGSKLA